MNATWPPLVPLGAHTVPAFPTERLPEALRGYTTELAESLQVPEDLPGILALTVVGATVAKRVEVQVTPDWREPCNLYTAVALPPAHRKSAVFSAMTAPLLEAEKRETERLQAEISRAQQERKVLEARIKDLEKRAAQAEPDERQSLLDEAHRLQTELPEVPRRPRLLADDVSPEKLANLLAENGGRVAVMSAEGGLFDMMGGRYSSGVPNLDVYLKGHAGDTLRVDRLGREPDFVENPALTIGLAVQPAVVQGLANKPGFRNRGLLGRFLYSLPHSLLGSRQIQTCAVNPRVRHRYTQLIHELHEIQPLTDGGQEHPYRLTLVDDALRLLNRYRGSLEPDLGPGGQFEHISDWAGKLPGAIVRLAGILHCTQHPKAPWEQQISRETMEAAIALGDYFKGHALAVFELMGSDQVTEDCVSVVRWLQRTGAERVSERDIHQAFRGRFKDRRALVAVLERLVEHHYLDPVPAKASDGPGRRPSPLYTVHPKARNLEPASQFAQNPHNGTSG